MDGDHDFVEAAVDFFAGPGHAHGVLAHFEAGGGDAACVGGFTGAVEDFCGEVGIDGGGGAGHVGAFADEGAAVVEEGFGVVAGDFVLGGAGEGALAGNGPGGLAFVVGAAELVGVFADASAFVVFEVHDPGEFFAGDAVGVVDKSAGVGEGDGFGAEVEEFFDGVLGDVAGAGDDAGFAFEGLVFGLEHFLGEVDGAVAGGFGANEGAPPFEAFAGEDAGEFVAEAFVLAEHVADFAGADADVASGDVGVGADVAFEFGHETLAEAHDFGVGFAFGVKVGSAFAAAHGEGGEGVFEDLFEAEEFEDALIDAGVEAESAFVGPDGAVELDAEAAVNVDASVVVLPGDAEGDEAFGFDDAFEDGVLFVGGFSFEGGGEGFEDFADGLEEFEFAGVSAFDFTDYGFDVVHECWFPGCARARCLD